MRLCVTTPFSVILEADEVGYVQAEDETGSFGILPGHGDFITALPASVILWRDRQKHEHYVVVRSAVLVVHDRQCIDIAAREAVGEDSLVSVAEAIASRFREEVETEEESRVASTRLHLAAIRQLQRYLDAGRDNRLGSGQPGVVTKPPGSADESF